MGLFDAIAEKFDAVKSGVHIVSTVASALPLADPDKQTPDA